MPNANHVAPQAPQAPRAKPKILVVDDNLVVLRTLRMKLEASGYEFLGAEDGSKAVNTVRSERPDLILLDIYFPPDISQGIGATWDGLQILSWLRHMEEAVNTPVIAISGSTAPEDRERCLQAGVADFLQKPIDRYTLLASIERILGRKPSLKS